MIGAKVAIKWQRMEGRMVGGKEGREGRKEGRQGGRNKKSLTVFMHADVCYCKHATVGLLGLFFS